MVESLAFGGEGIVRLDGKVCFVPGALPGERIQAVPISRKRRWDRMRLTGILRPSEERRQPVCSHTGLCGGCVLQPLRYESQLAAKAGQVRDCLERIGRITVPEDGPPLPSPILTGYRNKMEFTFAPRPWVPEGKPEGPVPGPALGLHVPGRYDAVFDVLDCALPSGACLAALETVRAFARGRSLEAWDSHHDSGLLRHLVVREGKNTGELLVALVVRRVEPILSELVPLLVRAVPSLTGFVLLLNTRLATVARGEEEILLWGRRTFRERLSGLTFDLQAQSFFQTNTWGAEVLLGAVHRMAANLGGGRLLDLYCGAGTLGLSLAPSFREVVGIEQIPQAVSDARNNAALNGIGNASFVEADVEEWLGRETGGAFDVAVVDPPRAGLHPRALSRLPHLRPRWILYVSCNPSTLARDAAGLLEAGYAPRRLQVVDLFPHTAHVESILLFQRGGA